MDSRVRSSHRAMLASSVCALLALWVSLAFAADDSPDDAPAPAAKPELPEPYPEFVSGDECLFCHRGEFASAWTEDRHQATVRYADEEPKALELLKTHGPAARSAKEVELVIGGERRTRFLKRAKAYGKLELLNVHATADGKIGGGAGNPVEWDRAKFASECAGCHSTAVDPRSGAFGTLALDCFACHGDVDLEHSKDQSKILFAEENKTSARVVASACGQCHLRGGKSKITGRPFPTRFTPGEDLFKHFEIDLSEKAIDALDPIDAHIRENVREILRGETKVTCLSCHRVHRPSSVKHRRVERSKLCVRCHPEAGGPNPAERLHTPKRWQKLRRAQRSETCEY